MLTGPTGARGSDRTQARELPGRADGTGPHACRVRHFSIRTEGAYHDWAERFIRFHGIKHPQNMAEPEVNALRPHLAADRRVTASTQNQALCVLLFLYAVVLERPLGPHHTELANRSRRLPEVLAREEVRQALARLDGVHRLIGLVLYGSEQRRLECMRLRVKDRDFALNQLVVREGKGDKGRRTVFPDAVKGELHEHLNGVQVLHARDTADGFGDVFLPKALAAKYPGPGAIGRGSSATPTELRARRYDSGRPVQATGPFPLCPPGGFHARLTDDVPEPVAKARRAQPAGTLAESSGRLE